MLVSTVEAWSQTPNCTLSVVIPAYNEGDNIRAGVLTQVSGFLDTCGLRYEVLIVDDGSVDETAELVRAFVMEHSAFRLIETPHLGKASALIHGIRAAKGRIVLFSDMDQATPIEEVSKLLPWFHEGFDIVIGSRGLKRNRSPLKRRFVSYAQFLARWVVLGFSDITDTQCGFKAFRQEIVMDLLGALVVYGRAWDQAVSGGRLSPGFDVEVLFAARKRGLSIKEVPVRWDHRKGRQAKLLRECARGFSDLLAIRAANSKGRYKTTDSRAIGAQ